MLKERMTTKRQGYITAFVLLLISLVSAMAVRAQEETVTAVLTHQTLIPGNNSVRLDLYLSLQNADGTPNADAVLMETAVLLADGSLYPAELSQEPTYLLLAVDASESMGNVLNPLRAAAITLVDGVPNGSNIAVIRYDENIDLLQSFSSDRAAMTDALNSIQVENDQTCTYDAAYAAMQALVQTAPNNPNRALVLISDGVDRDASGAIAAACSDYTHAQTVAYAAANDITIHIIGNDGVDKLPIADLATATGGTISSINDASPAPTQALLDSFSSQWIASATMQPAQGLQRGAALLTLADGSTPPPVPVQFVSPRDYVVAETAVPPRTIDISNFRYDSARDQFEMDVAVSDLSAVQILRVELLDGETNVQTGLVIVTDPQFSQRVTIAADGLTGSTTSIAHAYALNGSGGMVRNADGDLMEAFYTFQHTSIPQPAALTIQTVTVEDEAAKLDWGGLHLENDPPIVRVQFELENGEGAAVMRGRLLNLSHNAPSETFTVTTMLIGGVGTAAIARDLTEGDYTLVLTMMDKNGRSLTSDNTQFNYTAPDNNVGRAAKALANNPLLWLFFLLLLLVVAVVVGISSHRAGKKKGEASNVTLNSPLIAEVVEEETVAVQLTVVESADEAVTAVNQYQIDHFPFTIGREGADLTIADDKHVSRKHARITCVDGDYFIEDLDSANGTFLNKTKLAAHEPISLSPERGERITIGKTTTFTFGEQTER